MKFDELFDCIENSILKNYQHPVSLFFRCVEILKVALSSLLPPQKYYDSGNFRSVRTAGLIWDLFET
jgi:hypothetical protein